MKRQLVLSAALMSSVFAGCIISRAQAPASVDIVDSSPANCPVRLSGKIDLNEADVKGQHQTSYSGHLAATNLSDKTVIAMVIATHVGTSYGPLVLQYNDLDAYFSHALEVAPGKKYFHDHGEQEGPFFTAIREASMTTSPAANGKVIFVQFADGSTWGDNQNGHVTDLMNTRAKLFQSLQRLDAAAAKGETDFLKQLEFKSEDLNAESILNKVRYRQQQDGTAAAILDVREMLAVAAAR